MNLIHLHINSNPNLISDLFQYFSFSGGVGIVGGLEKIENFNSRGGWLLSCFFHSFSNNENYSIRDRTLSI